MHSALAMRCRLVPGRCTLPVGMGSAPPAWPGSRTYPSVCVWSQALERSAAGVRLISRSRTTSIRIKSLDFRL
jgi:hypothetical protein